MITLREIIKALTHEDIAITAPAISGAVIDSRLAKQNTLFIALKGENVDGNQFAAEALNKGAAFALVDQDMPADIPVLDLRSGHFNADATTPEKPCAIRVEDSLTALQTIAAYWRAQFTLKVIGITGSVGKSTTKEMIAEVLSKHFVTLKNAGNMNNEIGLPLTLLNLENTHQRAVLEMGFYVPGEIALLCNLAKPQVGVITNVGTVHAERAGSQETIARGKAELVAALPEDGTAILNYDDDWVRQMAAQTTARKLFYGLSSQADLWADEIEGLGLDGIRCNLHYEGESVKVRAPLMGRHSVYTLLRAAAVALTEGISLAHIQNDVQDAKIQLRLSVAYTENGAMILDDAYNASPESTLAALNLLKDLEGNKIAVLGDMLELGQYEELGHKMVGARAAEIVSRLFLVGERSKITQNAAIEAGFNPDGIKWYPTSTEAIDDLRRFIKKGDIVLIKGSNSMRMGKIVDALEVNR